MSEIRVSHFKVQAEKVESHFGIPPKQGAILYLESDRQLIYGDGYNWLDIGPGADIKAAVAVELVSGYSLPFKAGVEKKVTFYDTEIYNYLNKFVPSSGSQIKILGQFGVDYYAEYCIMSDVQGTSLTVIQRYNGMEVSREIELVEKDEHKTVQGYGTFEATPSNNWEVWAKTDRDCTLTACFIKLGMHERT